MSSRTVAFDPSVGEDADTSPAKLGRKTTIACGRAEGTLQMQVRKL